ncbi:uncharacterized protein LOC126995272 [Eriocheir sinensis]|uniref:uncharacterized protein LOC126995272 n=1 Tax=Eriocheir sinensis TaxID=95602 RepID=UPI0021C6E991|nr:uncharacterized protein LOC126995272 [Eriocheir sinensis]
MPPLRPVAPLRSLGTEALAEALTAAFVKAVGGTPLQGKKKRRRKRRKKEGRERNNTFFLLSLLPFLQVKTNRREEGERRRRKSIADERGRREEGRGGGGGGTPHPTTTTIYSAPTTAAAAGQINKVQRYLGESVPKSQRQALLHLVLLKVSETLTTTTRSKSRNRDDPGFELSISRLQRALSYTLDALLTSTVTFLDLTPLQHQVIKFMSTCRLNNSNPALTDKINPTRLENMLLIAIGENAKHLGNLSTLLWPHLVTGEVIRLIGGHCKSLKRLELACTCDSTFAMNYVKVDPNFAKQERALVSSLGALYDRAPGDFSGNRPAGCPSLRKLVLPRVDDEDGQLASHITRALCSLKDLEAITGAPMLVSLQRLKGERSAPGSLSLTHLSDIDTYNRRPLPDVSYLSRVAPKLSSIELITSEGVIKAVTSAFPMVNSLSICQTDFHEVARRFKNLRHLDINLEFQVAWPLLQALSKGRLPLTSLTLRHSTFQIGGEGEADFVIADDGDDDGVSALPTVRLPTLTSFTLIRSSFIEFNAMKALVSGTPNLSTLTITLSDDRNYAVDEFHDDLIRVVSPLLPALTSFTAECQYKTNLYNQSNCLLTMASAEALFVNCPRLSFLGHLDVWNVNEMDVKRLNKRIRESNWDLQVV